MQFSSRVTQDGVSLQFYQPAQVGGGTKEAGVLEICFDENGGTGDIVLKPQNGGGGSMDDLLYRLILEDCRTGTLASVVELRFRLYPMTLDVGRKRQKIRAACLYDKKGQYNRF